MNTTIFEIVHTYNDKHYMYKCKIGDLLKQSIINWEYNRPPDNIRCNDIASHIYTKKPILDWIFYMSYDTTTNKYQILDGIHRYTALKIIENENRKPEDFITPNIYGQSGDATWLYEMYILCSIRVNPTFGEEADFFQTLNKSIPVPELYMVDKNAKKREVIESIVNTWQREYKTHFTSNRKPNVPNTNRELFIELLTFIYDKIVSESMILQPVSENNMEDKLYELNYTIRNSVPKKISQKAIEKCMQTGCFLFLLKNDVLEDMI
jgi:hypothetical protein